ncbi:MAG: GNAT family N-acetyltransferase [Chloroflexota bacterium]|nr:GNAT family N-acetyltransferase [Chloroflexota bacterium]
MKKVKGYKRLILHDLGDGLILRRGSRNDADALAEFNAKIHTDDGPEQPDERIAAWTRDLAEKPHPTFKPGDFTIVENTSTGEIVSSLNLISQTWTYTGIPFGVGRPELVGTLPEYRNLGLIRAQFDVIHKWSDDRGELVQAITGIPYYYRQFEYEMGLSLGGGRIGYKPHVPKLKEDEQEPYQIRPAEVSDLDFIADLYQQASERYLISCLRDKTAWRYELDGKSDRNVNRELLRVIETNDGILVGYLVHGASTWGPTMIAVNYEVVPEHSWVSVTPSVVRYLYCTGESLAKTEDKGDDFSGFGFWLGTDHPVYQVMKDRLPRIRNPYAWFIRVHNLPDFLQHIKPVLDQRLENSAFNGHTGELKITFYRSGLRLYFQAGNLEQIEPWKPEPQGHTGDAAFPDLTFTQLLFGYRTLDELDYAYADCWKKDDQAYGLLNALFPKVPSNIWSIS